MPAAAGRAIVAGMTEAGNPLVRVELTLVPDAAPIQGWARSADGVVHAFSGWLELLEVLDRARINGPAHASAQPTTTPREGRPE